MSAWIQSYAALREHPKLKKLARLLGVRRQTAVGYLHYLWWWAMDYAPDGNLEKFDADDIADAIDWDGDAATFVTALRSCGLLDGNQLHDWEEYGGKLNEQREANAERVRRARAKHVTRTCDERNADVTGTCGAREERVKREERSTREEEQASPFASPEEKAMYLEFAERQRAEDEARGIHHGR